MNVSWNWKVQTLISPMHLNIVNIQDVSFKMPDLVLLYDFTRILILNNLYEHVINYSIYICNLTLDILCPPWIRWYKIQFWSQH